MSELHIDTDLGADAAAALADPELRYLCGISLWELAVRTGEDEFFAYLESVIAMRQAQAAELERTRHRRDQVQFAAQVMADIQRLPDLDGSSPEPGTGLYL